MCPFFIKFSGMKSVCCVDFIIIDDAYLIRPDLYHILDSHDF